MVVKFFLALVIFFFPFLSWPEVTLGPIIVEKKASFRDFFLKEENLCEFPSTSLESILDYFSSLDLRERGSFGIQTDLSIRGSIFEDNKVLIEGVEVNDPQTGHFSLELPFPQEALEDLELNPNTNEVNFRLKKPQEHFLHYKFFSGRHSLLGNSFSAGFFYNKVKNSLYLTQAKSKGDGRQDTDFNLYNICWISSYRDEAQEVNFLYSFLKKDFGADGFYASPFYREEEEHITQNFSYLSYLVKRDRFNFKLTPYFRRHFDKFILDRHNPSFYTNYHTTYIYGVDFGFIPKSRVFSLDMGLRTEKIDSTNLGEHKRERLLFSGRLLPQKIGRFLLEGSLSLINYSDWDFLEKIYFSLGYFLKEGLSLDFSFSKFYRIPSFTELFYLSPANKGNPDLKVQNTKSWELALNLQKEVYRFKVGAFLKYQDDSIDWVKDNYFLPWEAKNVGKRETRGWEADLRFLFRERILQEIGLSYTYLDLENKFSYSYSKYLFNYLRHKIVFTSQVNLKKIILKPLLVLEKPESLPLRLIANLKVDYSLTENISIFGEAFNLFNENYEEVKGVSSPGRLWRFGFEYQF